MDEATKALYEGAAKRMAEKQESAMRAVLAATAKAEQELREYQAEFLRDMFGTAPAGTTPPAPG